MNSLTLAALPALAATLLTTQSPAPIASADEEPPAPFVAASQPAPAASAFGPPRALQTGRLQPNTLLQSAALGLTPDNEWRVLFPVKPGTR